ncbi:MULTISPECIES: DUF72 domain-containing protein [unclassified Stenotrophomonas]|uniref:DUF72 domain-containing protein n=1 Tax=unclassified Stenotrophomonas TaxID=196198 RepID=UPI0010463C19|nr:MULTISPECIES: DUF72 domain-containing protein [unclassified Stenotrophomonas]MDV3514139.1 DUF72 domain-containing protein [Stenotrophomonas sp. C1657]TDB33775.1 DUF72 domain-containing protein [Stenotrophomonas sp. TEPEL]
MARELRHPRPGHPVAVGCAGWSLPTDIAHAFAAGDSALQRYASRFPIVEINSSFYRPHQPATYARWAASVPHGFRFSVKMPQAISHDVRLRGAAPLLDTFLHAVAHLGDRLGALLLQLPPSLAYDGRTASAFFRALRRRSAVPVACEPRHPSWFDDKADALLDGHGIARVAADPARVAGADQPGGARHWSYWRWHGQPRVYYSAYQQPQLCSLAAAALQAAQAGEAWIILDNTAHGNAVPNALQLQSMLEHANA